MSDISHCDMRQQIVDPADVKHLENLGGPANVRIEGTELYSGMSSEPHCDDRLTCITNHRTCEEDVKLLVSEVMRMLR